MDRRAHALEPYLPRRIAYLYTWQDADHAIKVYAIASTLIPFP